MHLDESEISEVHHFVKSLDSKKDCIVVVEGRKDEEALRDLGFSGMSASFTASRAW
ncbi:hypothetical protein DYY67_1287 [Candidatus Nitrosotalea sp. TS]|uniref:hypothetical protein n=1 Tax=Candidatus Nitrosotalea sp. TS TaxID=2341020 RepID=UPI0015B009E6|nr:hypothetical protein [Candidatus Nitrosotalea sp. TS]NHI03492.1 hypothetical protein [Candidatus Nitrosotalea sp. TS]